MKNILLIIIFFASCKNNSAPTAAASENTHNDNAVVLDSAMMQNAGVVIGTAREMNMHSTIKASGTVDVPPKSLVSVSFPMGGYLKTTSLLPGVSVSKGQPIAIIEDQGLVQLQQDYLTAKAKMEYTAADMQRQKDLSEAEAASRKNYQMVLSDYKTLAIQIKSLAEKLKLIHINPDKLTADNISGQVAVYSPIKGYVSRVNVNIGKYVTPSDVLFELVNPEDIHAAVTVFEKDISLFKKGMKGRVALADKPTEWHEIETILVTRNVDDNRTGLVHCHFENPDHNLLPGMFLNAEFNIDNKNVWSVPEDAVVRYMGKEYIFTTNDGKEFQLKEVKTGARENGMVALDEPATDWKTTRIVTAGSYAMLGKLKNKMEDD